MTNDGPYLKSQPMQRFINVLGSALVLLLSLLLLGCVGLGEAYRTYPRFQLDTLAAQGEVITTSMQGFVLAGLPLEQFPGFATLTQPLLASDTSIAAVIVTNAHGEQVVANAQPGIDLLSISAALFQDSELMDEQRRYTVAENPSFYRVTLELHSKFERVGSLMVFMPKVAIATAIMRRFTSIMVAGALLVAIYSGVVWWLTGQRRNRGGVGADLRWLGLAYGLTCLIMALVVISALISLYADGVQAKTQALARALQMRLLAPLDLSLDLDDFTGLAQVFRDNQALNPDISLIDITRNGRITVATDPRRVGTLATTSPNEIEYRLPLHAASDEIHVAIPTSVIYARLWRSIKNVIVLFVAVAFLSLLFFNLMRSFTARLAGLAMNAVQESAFQIGLIKPLYFLSVFIDGLTTSFLPQYVGGLARAAGISPNFVSLVFTAYFVGFVIVLIPAGRFAEWRGNKPLLMIALALVAMSQLMTAVITNFNGLIIVRAIGGIGQGMMYIGVQSFLLEMTAANQKTRSAAVIVYGYNGGMIAGTAIGALLVVYAGVRNVFFLAAAIALCLMVYVARLLPHHHHGLAAAPTHGFFSGLRSAAGDIQFVKSIMLIGIPAKAMLTGVTIFALPLLLAQQHYAQEDIGQIIMLYSIGVLISSTYVSRLVDTLGKTTRVLFIGAFASGLGLILVGALSWNPGTPGGWTSLPVVILSVGMTMLGIAHGCIHAPIITHIGDTEAARTLGKSTTASLYRLLERSGHMAGPMLVSYILVLNGGSSIAIAWIGLAIIGLGVLFVWQPRQRSMAAQPSEQQQ